MPVYPGALRIADHPSGTDARGVLSARSWDLQGKPLLRCPVYAEPRVEASHLTALSSRHA